MKPLAISLILIVCGCCAIALSGCGATYTYDPVTGKPITKTVVPDKDFTTALATAGMSAATTALKLASDDYLATHTPKSAVAAVSPPAELP